MKRLLLFGWILFAHTAPAQTVLRNVQETIDLARRQNPDLQVARQNRQTQEPQLTAARSALMPQARAFTNLDYNFQLPVQLIPAEFLPGGRPGEVREVQFGLPFNLTAGVEVTAPLLNKPARLDVELAQQNLQLIDGQNLILQDDISTQTARVYHAALLTRSVIDLARRNVANTDTIVTIARARLEKGLIEPLEVNRLQSLRLTNEDVLRQNELNYVRNMNQLKFLLGLTPQDSLVLTQNLAELVFASEPALTLAERPQVMLRRSQLDLYRLQYDREKALRRPTLSAYTRYSAQAQRRQFNFLNVNQPWFPIGVAGLQFNVPIYTGGIRDANLTRARLRIRQAETELAVEQNRIDVDNQDVLNTYNQAIQSLDLNRQNLALSEQNTRIALVKYRSGLFAYDQYLNVFNEAINAQNRYLTNLSNALVNLTILEVRK